MTTAILAVLLFGVMILPHELGHFIAARLVGVKVNEFSFGMGPKLWGKQGKETLYSIRAFPLGGVCAMEGEDEESDEPRAFGNKKPWQKLIVLAAGSFMNIVCATLIMMVVVGIMGFTTNSIGEMTEGSAARAAGLHVNDEIIQLDDTVIERWEDVSAFITASDGSPMVVKVLRDGKELTVNVTPKLTTFKTTDGGTVDRYVLGITSKMSHSPLKAFLGGFEATWNMTKEMFKALGMLFNGEAGVGDLSGPVGIVKLVDETSSVSWSYYVYLMAFICINVGIFNLLPFPALDGGRIIFVIFSWITKKPVSQKVEGTVHLIGFALLICLVVFVTWNDICRLVGWK